MVISLKEYQTLYNSNSFPWAWSIFPGKNSHIFCFKQERVTGTAAEGSGWYLNLQSVSGLFCLIPHSHSPTVPGSPKSKASVV